MRTGLDGQAVCACTVPVKVANRANADPTTAMRLLEEIFECVMFVSCSISMLWKNSIFDEALI
jgi:hypothetical protein